MNDDDDEENYFDYTPTTVNPDPWITIGVTIFSILCILMLPVLVWFRKRKDRRHKKGLEFNALRNESQLASTPTTNGVLLTISDVERVKENCQSHNNDKNYELEPKIETKYEGMCEEKLINTSGHQDIPLMQEDVDNKTSPKGGSILVSFVHHIVYYIKHKLHANSVQYLPFDPK